VEKLSFSLFCSRTFLPPLSQQEYIFYFICFLRGAHNFAFSRKLLFSPATPSCVRTVPQNLDFKSENLNSRRARIPGVFSKRYANTSIHSMRREICICVFETMINIYLFLGRFCERDELHLLDPLPSDRRRVLPPSRGHRHQDRGRERARLPPRQHRRREDVEDV
jgi:hypothetical protein